MNAASSSPRPFVLWGVVSGVKVLKILSLNLLIGCTAVAEFAPTGPLESLKRFSEFRSLQPSRLLDGEILGERGALMQVPEGICAQTCFAVRVPPSEAAHRLQIWNPSQHEAPNVLAFSQVSAPCGTSDFENLILGPGHHALQWLLEKSCATTARRSELNLTYGEARQLADWTKANSNPQGVSAFWARLLLDRTRTFQRLGFAGVPPYELGGKVISPAKLLQMMLHEKGELTREFAPVLQRSGMVGNEPTGTLEPFYYWGLCEANRRGTLNLGAVYSLPLGDRYQLLDAQYYVSGTYYTYLTLYEIWPIRDGERLGTLVWRGDFFAAPTLAVTKGTERLAYGAIMLQELKKAVRCFQKDVTANR